MKNSLVTKISGGVKNPSRVNIFIDGQFCFSLSITEVVDLKIKVGNQYSDEELEQLKHTSNFGKLYQRTLEYALSRPHSEKEIRDYLRRKKIKNEIIEKKEDNYQKNFKIKNLKKTTFLFSDQDVEEIIRKLKQRKYIDDGIFARYFVENRRRIKGSSEKKLKMELRSKGISENVIEELFMIDESGKKIRDDECEINKIIEKKRRLGYNDQKLASYLFRQGFSYDLIKSKLQNIT